MGWPVGWTDAGREEVGEWLDLGEDPAEWDADDARYIGRTTTRRTFRAPRIKCLGNGQVPLCAAVSFEEGLRMLEGAAE